MLVSVAESIQNVQGVYFRKPILSEARLQSLDDCARFFGDSLQVFLLGSVIVPTFSFDADGKLRTLAFRRRFDRPSQTTDQIVEGGSHIENAVSDDGAQMNWRRESPLDPPRNFRLGKIRIILQGKLILCSLQEFASFDLEGIEVHACPVYFGDRAPKP
jgi:hypothetical protein